MNKEEGLKELIAKGLNLPEDKVTVSRIRRLSAEVEYPGLKRALEFITKDLNFVHLSSITGLDEGQRLGIIYHLSDDAGVVLSLKTGVDKNNPVVMSITDKFPSAEVYERELVDLLGFKVDGLPEGSRYPLTDDWPKDEHPLRKDWKPKK
jgi:Ni,Fe-hydrogenase III component G